MVAGKLPLAVWGPEYSTGKVHGSLVSLDDL